MIHPISRTLDETFKISVSLKGLDGLLEAIGGTLLLIVKPDTINKFARVLTQYELSRDPHDFIANHLLHSASQLTTGTTLFAALYLLSHGLAKIILVIAVLRQQLWAYPGMIVLIGAFIVYQVYRLTIHLSLGLILLTLFDMFVIWLTWREWQAKHQIKPEPS